jgi:hypothetical protein
MNGDIRIDFDRIIATTGTIPPTVLHCPLRFLLRRGYGGHSKYAKLMLCNDELRKIAKMTFALKGTTEYRKARKLTTFTKL